jgi:hypothetical protein
LSEITLRKVCFAFFLILNSFSSKQTTMRFKKAFATSKNASVLSSLLQKRVFFVLPDWQKAKRMNTKTEGPVQLLFCLVSVSHSKMVLFAKKKQIVCWKLCFQKTFFFVHKTPSGLLVSKNKSKC